MLGCGGMWLRVAVCKAAAGGFIAGPGGVYTSSSSVRAVAVVSHQCKERGIWVACWNCHDLSRLDLQIDDSMMGLVHSIDVDPVDGALSWPGAWS